MQTGGHVGRRTSVASTVGSVLQVSLAQLQSSQWFCRYAIKEIPLQKIQHKQIPSFAMPPPSSMRETINTFFGGDNKLKVRNNIIGKKETSIQI